MLSEYSTQQVIYPYQQRMASPVILDSSISVKQVPRLRYELLRDRVLTSRLSEQVTKHNKATMIQGSRDQKKTESDFADSADIWLPSTSIFIPQVSKHSYSLDRAVDIGSTRIPTAEQQNY